MRVRFIGGCANARGTFEPGDVADLPDNAARPLIHRGIAEADDSDPAAPREPAVEPRDEASFRADKIRDAIHVMAIGIHNRPELAKKYLTKSEKPKVEALEALSGLSEITAEERDAIFEEMTETFDQGPAEHDD